MGFTINPPDINLSDLNFKVAERRTIQFGLAAIKGIGESALKPLIQERQANGPFLSISDLCRRINLALVGKKNLELLIQAGAFDRFQIRRKDLFGAIRNIVEFNQRQHEAKSSGQMTLFDMLGSQTVAADDRGAPWESLRSVKPGKKPWDFEDLYLEKKILGAFISGHPLHFYRNDFKVMASQAIKNFPAIADQNDKRGKNEKVQIGVLGMVATHNIRRTKKGTLIAGIKIEQEQAIFEAMMFEKALEKAKIPDPETPAMFYGSVDKNFDHTSIRFTIDRIIPLENVRQQRVKGLLVKLNVDPSSDPAEEKTTIESLKGLLASHPGDKPVLININFAKAIIRFTTSLKANISNLFLRELEDLSPNISYDLMTKIPEDHIPDPIPRESFSSL
jgi:DNA polymerase-3 subunit alpha